MRRVGSWSCILWVWACATPQAARPPSSQVAPAPLQAGASTELGSPGHAPRISAIALRVADAPRALAFYVGLLGMVERGRVDAGGGSVEIALGFPNAAGAELRLLDVPGSEPPSPDDAYSRVGFRVADIAGVVARLSAGGATVLRGATRVEALKLSYALARDPDGGLIELLQFDAPSSPGAPLDPLPRIGFVSFALGDAPTSVGFYQRVFGLRETGRFEANPNTTELFVGFPDAAQTDANLVLMVHKNHQGSFAHGTLFDRFAIRVPDLAAVVSRLEGENVSWIRGPSRPPGAAPTPLRFRDPDGYTVEILE